MVVSLLKNLAWTQPKLCILFNSHQQRCGVYTLKLRGHSHDPHPIAPLPLCLFAYDNLCLPPSPSPSPPSLPRPLSYSPAQESSSARGRMDSPLFPVLLWIWRTLWGRLTLLQGGKAAWWGGGAVSVVFSSPPLPSPSPCNFAITGSILPYLQWSIWVLKEQ
jgi:hypothetical protein